jgi:hypothetical protein
MRKLSEATPAMTDRVLQISEVEFDRRFPLLANHIDCNATWAFGEGPGCLFGISHEELAFVRAQPAGQVWTLVDCDEGMSVISGFHFVNRIGYLVSTHPVRADTVIEVRLKPASCD